MMRSVVGPPSWQFVLHVPTPASRTTCSVPSRYRPSGGPTFLAGCSSFFGAGPGAWRALCWAGMHGEASVVCCSRRRGLQLYLDRLGIESDHFREPGQSLTWQSVGLCRRRGWQDPTYEIYRDTNGYTCLVLVNGRKYQTDLAYESDGLAQENAAMRAFMVCRNFSVNGGMFVRNGIIQGLPDNTGKRSKKSHHSPSASHRESRHHRSGRHSSSSSTVSE